jgi:hypothetical protein
MLSLTVEDYESMITLLTEWLYIAAQMPHGTHAQQNVQRTVQRAGRVAAHRRAAVPDRGDTVWRDCGEPVHAGCGNPIRRK